MLRLIIIFLMFMFIRFCLQSAGKIVGFINKSQQKYNHNNNNHKNDNKNIIQDLAQCTYCGLYIPIEESIDYHGKKFCCTEHIH